MTQKTQRPGEEDAVLVAVTTMRHDPGAWMDALPRAVAAAYPLIAAAVLRSAADVLSEGGDRRAAQVLERLANEQEARDA